MSSEQCGYSVGSNKHGTVLERIAALQQAVYRIIIYTACSHFSVPPIVGEYNEYNERIMHQSILLPVPPFTFCSDSPDMPETTSGAEIFRNGTPSSPMEGSGGEWRGEVHVCVMDGA